MANNDTKACNLTVDEIEELIKHHGRNVEESIEGRMERLNYLHKRYKAFFEPTEEKPQTAPATTAATNEVKSVAEGWGAPSNG